MAPEHALLALTDEQLVTDPRHADPFAP